MFDRLPIPFLQGLVFLLTLIGLPAFAQEPYLQFGRIDGDQNIANVDVVDITQDSQGFIWFATRGHGLVRYDGYEFRVFSSDPVDPNSLSHNDVIRIYVDAEGTMWVSTAVGTNIYDPTTETFTVLTNETGAPELTGVYVNGTAVDRDGTLWIADGGGLLRKDRGTSTFRSYRVELEGSTGYMPFFSEYVFVDSSDTVWVGTLGSGLLRYERATDSFTRFLHNPNDASSIANDHITQIYEDSKGIIWISTDGGLSRKDANDDRFQTFFATETERVDRATKIVGPVLEDSYGNFWVAVNNHGVYKLDRDTGSSILFSHDPTNPRSLASNSITSIFQDHGGVIWFGSDVVSFLVPSNHAFSQVRNPAENLGTHDRVPNAMIQSRDGSIWIDGMEGVDRYNPVSGTWKRFSLFPGDPANPSNEVTAIHEDSTGTIWLGQPNHISQLDPESGRHTSIEIPFAANSILVDDRNSIWAGLPTSTAGLYEVNFGNQSISPASSTNPGNDRSPPGMLSGRSIRFISQDHSGHLWVGTYTGLNRRKPNNTTFMNYVPKEADQSSVSSNEVRTFFQDSNEIVWLGSANGLNQYRPETDNFNRFYFGTSTRPNRINDIVEDQNGLLWLATGGGLTELNPSTGTYRLLNADDGLPGIFGDSIVHGIYDGLIYLATSSGLVTVDPSKVAPSSTKPEVVLTDFRLNNRSVPVSDSDNNSLLSSSITTTRHITLRPEHSFISFGFSTLDYVNPAENQYAYKLVGFDDEWVQTDSKRRIASYTNLPAGDYEFRVKAANSEGIWNETGAAIELTVLPPWFRTYWAYLAYLMLLAFLIAGLTQFRTRTLRVRGRELEKLVDERTEELKKQKDTIEQQALNLEELIVAKDHYFTNVSHEFRTPLAVILGPIDRLLARIGDIEARRYLQTVRRNGSRLLRMVDQLLGLSRLESGQTESASPHSVRSTVFQIVASLESFANDKRITLDAGAVEDVWVQSSGDAAEEIVMNLLSNALKYTPLGGKVIVSAIQDDDIVCIKVADTGPGIPIEQHDNVFERFYRVDDLAESAPGSGLGLALVKELVIANGGEIKLDSTPEVGTIFYVRLPAAETPGIIPEEGVANERTSTTVKLNVASLADSIPIERKANEDILANLLVIEDNLDLCRHLEEIFGSTLNCTFEHDGQSGLDTAIDDIPDVIICDAMLPSINGFEVTRHLKQDDRTSHIPIIMLTARVDEQSRLRGLKALADDYITKPFNEIELRQRVDTILAVREILRLRYSRDVLQLGAAEFRETMSERDRRFVARVDAALAHNFSDPNFTTSQFASDVAMSERQLQRKLRALMNYTPREYLRNYRLSKAARILRAGTSVADAAYSVGFLSLSYFAKCFKAQFGVTPSDVLDSSNSEQSASDDVG